MHLKDNSIVVTKTQHTAEEFIQKKIELLKDEAEPFFAVDLEDVCNKHIRWLTSMPRVTPHYAVKCNDDINVIKLLAYLGAGFDCASKGEIKKVMDLGVSADRIIYANPCKQTSYIRYAEEVGVQVMTFDNEQELLKIKKAYPNAKLVLRLITDDSNAVCRFSMKFGADMNTARKLLEKAQEIDMEITGVSFHCGSGQMTSKAFVDAIQNARTIMNFGNKLGFNMNLLDIGGGFPGNTGTEDYFSEIAAAVNKTLEEHFPDDGNIRIIAEPGRYYVASAYTLATNVIASREMIDSETGNTKYMYYVNDGVYGSFNCVLYDHYVPQPHIIAKNESNEKYTSSIWGPTCDGLDCINTSIEIPKLNIGEWVLWKNMGAYTISAAVQFNGLPYGKPLYFMSKQFWDTVRAAFQSVPRKFQFETPVIRLNSSDCSNEVEDDMLPWLLEDLSEETTVVTIQ
jgi:diaminopimelate decarboxylase